MTAISNFPSFRKKYVMRIGTAPNRALATRQSVGESHDTASPVCRNCARRSACVAPQDTPLTSLGSFHARAGAVSSNHTNVNPIFMDLPLRAQLDWGALNAR